MIVPGGTVEGVLGERMATDRALAVFGVRRLRLLVHAGHATPTVGVDHPVAPGTPTCFRPERDPSDLSEAGFDERLQCPDGILRVRTVRLQLHDRPLDEAQ